MPDPNEDQKSRFRDFMDAFGHALIEWQFVEENLYKLFALISGIEDDLATAVYYSINSTHGHVKLVDEVAKTQLKATPDLLKQWTKLAATTRTQADHRNKIAHGVASVQSLDDGTWMPTIDRPSAQSARSGEDHWTAARMTEAIQSFAQLHMNMYQFGQLLSARPKPGDPVALSSLLNPTGSAA